MIRAKGTYAGRDVELVFDDGDLRGDDLAVTAVRHAIALGIDTSIAGVVGGPASIVDDATAAAVFLTILDDPIIDPPGVPIEDIGDGIP